METAPHAACWLGKLKNTSLQSAGSFQQSRSGLALMANTKGEEKISPIPPERNVRPLTEMDVYSEPIAPTVRLECLLPML